MKRTRQVIIVAALGLAPARAYGACLLQGAVIDGSTQRPIANAKVFAEPRSEQNGIPVRHLTNEQGEFCFEHLEPGKYVVSALHSGYLDANYGERHPGASPLLLDVSAEKNWPNLVIKMTPQAVISGRVVDADGDPIGNATVALLKRGWSDGKIGASTFSDVQTDDDGNFRHAHLAPGTYYVSAERESGHPAIIRERLDNKGQPFHERETQTYYDGALSFRGATPIVVKVGQEITGVNVVMQKTALRELSGRLPPGWNSAGKSMLWLTGYDGGVTATIAIQKDGSFRADGILPGEYLVQSLGSMPDSNLMARTSVDLTEHDADGLILEPVEMMTFKLAVRTDRSSADGKRSSIDQIMLSDPKSGDGYPGEREPDGTFRFSGVPQGLYTVEFNDLYFIKRVIVDGQFENGSSLDLRRAQPKLVELVVSSNMGALTGKIVADHPITTGVTVILQARRAGHQRKRLGRRERSVRVDVSATGTLPRVCVRRLRRKLLGKSGRCSNAGREVSSARDARRRKARAEGAAHLRERVRRGTSEGGVLKPVQLLD